MKKWSAEEESFLLNIPANDLDIYDISDKLSRSVGSVCKKIYRLRGIDLRNSIIGTRRRAINHYNLIKNRLKTSHIRKKNFTYKNVLLKVSKDDFVEWFMKNDFRNCSVDRINNNGDYSLDNMQLINLSENIRKDKIKAHNGLCECCVCHIIKSLNDFVKDNRRFNGYSTICKDCERKRHNN